MISSTKPKSSREGRAMLANRFSKVRHLIGLACLIPTAACGTTTAFLQRHPTPVIDAGPPPIIVPVECEQHASEPRTINPPFLVALPPVTAPNYTQLRVQNAEMAGV